MTEPIKMVVAVGDKTLTFNDGSINYEAFKNIALLLSDLNNSGAQISLISAGAIVMGTQVLQLKERAESLSKKQAIAAVGQVELIKTYQDLFLSYGQHAAQVLLTRSTVLKPKYSTSIRATIDKLLSMNVIPIINENDSVSTDDIELEDNYPLAARFAKVIDAHCILLASNIQNRFHVISSGNIKTQIANSQEEVYAILENTSFEASFGDFRESLHELILNSSTVLD